MPELHWTVSAFIRRWGYTARMDAETGQYFGFPDFHDGYIRNVSKDGDSVHVDLEGCSGALYLLRFKGVKSVESLAPEGMMLYAVRSEAEGDSLSRFTFVNWYVDEPKNNKSKAFLVVTALDCEILQQ